ncbi:hypothetical protein KOI35_44955 [Actinoplanes bogorensis]|uniref:Uncharacterized protein n=1 Tax=Paractinoplanes bogorensis TaxID=1610840 RepID=A0ABS5Z4R0_9ACTN|nr:hypothetical protein [Actinoplanes bogorensis]MBU2670673.1 hypothetical protein [Actinoplanes bogorensis]
MRPSLLLLAIATAGLIIAPAAPAFAAAPCSAADSATYRHTFDGNSGQTTISPVRPLCDGQKQSFALIAYTAGTANAGQFVYSTDRATITSTTRSVTLDVVVPPCYAQVDAVFGSELVDEATSSDNPYGSRTLGAAGSRSAGPPAHYRGGSSDCTPAPKVAFTSACDGSYTATLSNAANANVSAAFLVAGRLLRLAPGRSTTVDGVKGGSLTIRDSAFTSYVGTWRPPAIGCTTVTTPPASAVPTTQLAAPLPPSVPGLASVPATAAATTDAPGLVYAAPTTTAAPAPATTKKGMSMGSIIAIAFGLVLIGGGAILLTRVIKAIREPV